MSRRLVVAIDGPAGAGKTSVSQRLADALGYIRLDTGALYRTVALAVLNQGVSVHDEAQVAAIAQGLSERGAIQVHTARDGSGKQTILLDGGDVSLQIREPEVAAASSVVATYAGVRGALLAMQRERASRGGVVLEGRDIGTVVLPNADAKFFLTASVEVRAKRRYEELLAAGKNAEYEAVRSEVAERDRRDYERPIAPLRQADDALLVDSSGLDIDGVIELMAKRVRELEAAG